MHHEVVFADTRKYSGVVSSIVIEHHVVQVGSIVEDLRFADDIET